MIITEHKIEITWTTSDQDPVKQIRDVGIIALLIKLKNIKGVKIKRCSVSRGGRDARYIRNNRVK